MSRLADILDAETAELTDAWTTRLSRAPGVPQASESGLRHHLPDLIRELGDALRAGVVPAELRSARAHGAQRELLGFDLELLVQEYGLLSDAIFDLVERRAIQLELGEVRVITRLMTLASAQGVDAYVRREEALRRQREESARASEMALRTQADSQQEQLAEVLDAIPVLVSFVTADERYALVNKAYESWFGIPRERVVGSTLREVISATRCHTDERERLLRAEREAHGRTEFLLSVAAAMGRRASPYEIMRRVVDIIVPARGHVASAWERDADGSFALRVSAGPAALEAPADPSETQRWIAHVAVTGTTLATRSRAEVFVPVRRDGEVLAVLAISRLDPDAFSTTDVELFETAAQLVAIALESAHLFEETERLRRTAEAATAAKDRFLTHVSHDLRNPLGSILGWTSLLRKTRNLAQVERGIDVIERNARAQVRLIDDLLDVSRIATGKLALHLSVEDVRVAVDTALDPARISAQTKGVRLSAFVADDVGTAAIDPDRFRQILWNLASNAVKFTPAGGSVCVSVSRAESKLEVIVADTGRGIAPAFLPHVFDRLEQASADSRRSGGLGLGLAIVRHLVELHGGTVSVESALGAGTTFTVVLPV